MDIAYISLRTHASLSRCHWNYTGRKIPVHEPLIEENVTATRMQRYWVCRSSNTLPVVSLLICDRIHRKSYCANAAAFLIFLNFHKIHFYILFNFSQRGANIILLLRVKGNRRDLTYIILITVGNTGVTSFSKAIGNYRNRTIRI